MAHLPTGTIILWFGAIVDIPLGFVLCDGAGGTPNLQNKFLVGSGDTYVVDEVGGSVDHNHAVTTTPHDHAMIGGTGIQAGAGVDSTTDTDAPPGTTDTVDNLPPFHSLAYIMKT